MPTPRHSTDLLRFGFDAEELAELDLELARMDVRDVAGRLLQMREELSLDSAA